MASPESQHWCPVMSLRRKTFLNMLYPLMGPQALHSAQGNPVTLSSPSLGAKMRVWFTLSQFKRLNVWSFSQRIIWNFLSFIYLIESFLFDSFITIFPSFPVRATQSHWDLTSTSSVFTADRGYNWDKMTVVKGVKLCFSFSFSCYPNL